MDKRQPENAEEIRKALADISEMKETIRGNLRMLRPVMYDKRFIRICYVWGAILLLFFGSLQIALNVTADSGLPLWAAILYAAAGVVIFAAGVMLKYRVSTQNLVRRGYPGTYRQIFSYPEYTHFCIDILAYLILVCAVCVYASIKTGNWWIMLPGMLIYFAIMFIHSAVLFYLKEYRVIGFCSGLLGIVCIIFLDSLNFLWLGIVLCVFFVLFAVVIQIIQKRNS